MQCAGIRAWLEKSGGLPLIITQVASTRIPWGQASNQFQTFPDFQSFLDVLGDFSSRWKTIKLNIPDRAIPALASIKTVPLLETLHISEYFEEFSEEIMNANVAKRVDFTGNAPKLHTFVMKHNSMLVQSMPLPRHQITHLIFRNSPLRNTGQTIRHILHVIAACCETLEFLELMITRFFVAPWGLNEPVAAEPNALPTALHLPSLRILRIINRIQGNMCLELCGLLVTPRLVDLLFHDKSCASFASASVTRILKNSGCMLKTLDVCARYISGDELLPALSLAPSLVTLSIRSSPNQPREGPQALSDSFVNALTLNQTSSSLSTAASSALCTMLENVSFTNCPFSETTIVEMLLSRAVVRCFKDFTPIKKIQVVFLANVLPGDDYGEGLEAVLGHLRKDGLEVTFKYAPGLQKQPGEQWAGISPEIYDPWSNYVSI